LKLDPANAQAKSGLASVKRAIDAEAAADGASGDPTAGLGNLFNDPQLLPKLANNPKTRSLLADQQFMAKLQKLKQNPTSIGEEMRDPRILQVVGVLLGLDMQFGQPGEGGNGDPPSYTASTARAQEDTPMPDAQPSSANSQPSKAAEPEPEDEETTALKKAREEAEAEKKLGTENYKKRQFDAAIEHYGRAWDLYRDITYLTNLGAAKYEKGDYEGAVEACNKAVEEGREMRADFKLIAK
jgi:stress-induced-phosphoprotein 1